MSFFLVFLAILAVGGVTLVALGRLGPGAEDDGGTTVRRWQHGEVPAVQGLVEPTPNLPPVLLPDRPTADDVDRLRFSLGFRGYRMDQVDEVLDRLRDQLADQQVRIAELEQAEESSALDDAAGKSMP